MDSRTPSPRPPSRGALASAALFLAGAVVGCGPSTYTFSVELKNGGAQPVTTWLTKRGGPDEDDWLAPETIAQGNIDRPSAINGVVVPPGKTATIGPIKGKFDPGSAAVLRVYAGQLTLEQMLATRPDGKLRVDVPLELGTNRLAVTPGQLLTVAPQ